MRVLVTFWYHYMEIQRITPMLYPGEGLDFEGRQEEVENLIKEREKPLWWLNRFYIRLSKIRGVMLPLTLIFPSIFLVGSVILFFILCLVIFKVI